MIFREFSSHVVSPALGGLPSKLNTLAAHRLLLMTAAHESGGFRHLRQIQGPALSFYQIEPATHFDLWENYLKHRSLLARCVSDTGVKKPNDALVTDQWYATRVARAIYWRVPEAMPDADNLTSLARYAKEHWNTHLGKATATDYLNAYLNCYGEDYQP